MKTMFWLLLSALPLGIFAQDSSAVRYVAPENWRSESVALPPDFAPAFPFQGEGIVHFSPGWHKQEDDQFWTYSMLWLIKDQNEISTDSLKTAWESYFDGLLSKIMGGKLNESQRTKVSLAKTVEHHQSQFVGSIVIHDAFFSKQKVVLKVFITARYCVELEQWTVLHYLSPKTIEPEKWTQQVNCE